MGNQFCLGRDQEKHQLLDEEEYRSVQKLYEHLKGLYEDTYKNNYINEECLSQLIPDKPTISLKIYNHICDRVNSRRINLNNFSDFIGKMIKMETQNRMTRIEYYTSISIQRIFDQEGDYGREKISYLEAFDLLMEIEYFLQDQGYFIIDYEPQDESTARSILSRLFTSSAGSIQFFELCIFLEQSFPYLSFLLIKYFYSLFITQKNLCQTTKFSKPSYLMNNSVFGYISLSSSIVQEAEHFNLLYTSTQNGWQFETLYQILISYKGPTLILIKFDEKTFGDDSDEEELKQSKSTTKQGKYSIVGAFNACQWIETNSYQGTSQNLLYQIYPKFIPYPTCNDVFKSKRLGSQNFSYLNKNDQKKGLGFGGNMKTFRLWLDAEYMQQSSYALPDGEPFLKGELVDPAIITASVTYVEVWGVGDQGQSISGSEQEIKDYRDSTFDLLQKYQQQ